MSDRSREAAGAFCAAQDPRLVGSLALYVGDRAVAEELAQEASSGPSGRRPRPCLGLAVRQAVAALPQRQRTALILRYYLDLAVEEAACRMDASPDVLRSLTERALPLGWLLERTAMKRKMQRDFDRMILPEYKLIAEQRAAS